MEVSYLLQENFLIQICLLRKGEHYLASSAQVIPARDCLLVKFPQSPERTATSYPGYASVPDAISTSANMKFVA